MDKFFLSLETLRVENEIRADEFKRTLPATDFICGSCDRLFKRTHDGECPRCGTELIDVTSELAEFSGSV
jgi:rubrerythrin